MWTRVRIDAPIFNGGINPNIFLDWLNDIKNYFDLHNLPPPNKYDLSNSQSMDLVKIISNVSKALKTRHWHDYHTLSWDEKTITEAICPPNFKRVLLNKYVKAKQHS